MSTMIYWLFFAVIYVMAIPLIYFPVYIRLKSSRTFLAYIEEKNPASFPQAVFTRLNETGAQLAALNFRVATYYYEKGAVPGVTSYGMILVNDNTGDMAIDCVTNYVVNGREHIRNIFQFYTCFEDGREIITDNSNLRFLSKRPEKQHFCKAPGITDLVQLYKIHQEMLKKHAAGPLGYVPEQGREVVFLFSKMNRNLEHLVEQGYMYKDYDRQLYRYSWKGAALLSWPQIFPFNIISKKIHQQKAKLLLNS
jgi:hypothetical protein